MPDSVSSSISDTPNSPATPPPSQNTPQLPALIADLPGDDTRAAQHQFSAEKQAKFLNRLAACGSARSAVRSAGISHQTAYRHRRACRTFRRAWDAALLVAREQAEEELAVRAIDGVEEEVFYHGEPIAKRRRFDSRLLLAHLARLDKLAQRADVAMLARDFDAVVDALEAGRDLPEPPAEEGAGAGSGTGSGNLGSGQCNMRSMSRATSLATSRATSGATSQAISQTESEAKPPVEPMPDCECVGARYGTDGGKPHFHMTPRGPEPVCNPDGSGPCCDRPCWPDCRACPHYPSADRALQEMEEQRPAHAPPIEVMGAHDEVEACQLFAFEAGDDEWWLLGEGFKTFGKDSDGGWGVIAEPDDEEGDCAEEGA